MKRLAVLVSQYGESYEHDHLVTLFWRMLEAGDSSLAKELHSAKQKYKAYTWAYQAHPTGGLFTFSTIHQHIADAVERGAMALVGQGIMIEDRVFEIVKVLPVQPVQRIGARMTLKAVSPISLSFRNEKSKKEYAYLDKSEEYWKSLCIKNLVNRARNFYGLEIPEKAVSLRIVNKGTPCNVHYIKTAIPARKSMILELQGDPKLLELAIYGGLGERTGSGFGMVTPV